MTIRHQTCCSCTSHVVIRVRSRLETRCPEMVSKRRISNFISWLRRSPRHAVTIWMQVILTHSWAFFVRNARTRLACHDGGHSLHAAQNVPPMRGRNMPRRVRCSTKVSTTSPKRGTKQITTRCAHNGRCHAKGPPLDRDFALEIHECVCSVGVTDQRHCFEDGITRHAVRVLPQSSATTCVAS